jgi:hypothetical protein
VEEGVVEGPEEDEDVDEVQGEEAEDVSCGQRIWRMATNG